MRLMITLFMALMLSACGENQAQLAAARLSGTVLILNIPKGDKAPTAEEGSGGGLGTGFLIEPNLIVTNNHVVAGGNTVKVVGYRDNKAYAAKVVASAPEYDLAIVSVDDWADFQDHVRPQLLAWGSSRDMQVGDTVWSMGNPYGLTWTVAQGIVSHKLRSAGKARKYYIQTTTNIMPGNSGGPLLNSNGEVIGVNSAIVGKEGYFGMAIPSDQARKVVDDLRMHGKVQDARMGIHLDETKDEHHVRAAEIERDCTCIAAGLLPNDAIMAIRTDRTNGQWVRIDTPDDLIAEVMLLRPDDQVSLEFARDGKQRRITFPTLPVTADP